MCNFCENVSTGDNYHPMIEGIVDLGSAGQLFCDVVLERENGVPKIALNVCHNYSSNNQAVRFNIKYCPVCGCQLGEGVS